MRVRYSFSSRRTGIIEGNNRHREAFSQIVKEVVRMADIILEVLDARFPQETRNLELENFIKEQGKQLIFVLNKTDLVDINELKKTIIEQNLEPYILLSCKIFKGKRGLRERLYIESKRLKLNRVALVGVVGYPNTGKSSLINLLIGRRSAGISAQAGFTKGMQKIRFTKDIQVIDTPGVIAAEDMAATEKEDLVKSTKLNIKTYDRVKNPLFIVVQIMNDYPGLLENHYNLDAKGDSEELIEQLGRKKHYLLKGNKVDSERVSRFILKEWQTGVLQPRKLGRSVKPVN